ARDGGGDTNGIASMRTGHRARPKLIHDLRAPDHRRQRQRTADAFTAANDVGRDAIMFKRPEFSGAPEAGLDFVEDQRDVVLLTPRRELFNIWHRREVGADALIAFDDDAGDVLVFEPFFVDRFQ